MTVWAVESCYDVTECKLLAIFSSEDLAQQYANRHPQRSLVVAAWEVDEFHVERIREAKDAPKTAD